MWGKTGIVRGLCVIVLAWLIAGPALAGSFSINPVQISLPADQRAALLTIRNSGVAPVSISAQALQWTQVDGNDHLSPTTNVIVSPPIFTIPAGATQLVRVGLKDRAASKAYRLILEEIPKQKKVPGQVQVTLRLNMPIYVPTTRNGKPQVAWRAWRSGDGTVTVEGRNSGAKHLQVTALIGEQEGKTETISKAMGVVLPDSIRIWKSAGAVPLQPGAPFTLTVKSPTGDAQTQIPLESR